MKSNLPRKKIDWLPKAKPETAEHKKLRRKVIKFLTEPDDRGIWSEVKVEPPEEYRFDPPIKLKGGKQYIFLRQPPEEDWIKGLDKEFYEGITGAGLTHYGYKQLISFISRQLKRERQKVAREIEMWAARNLIEEVVPEDKGWNQALTRLASYLSGIRKSSVKKYG